MCTINVSLAPGAMATGALNGTLTATSGGAMQQTTLSGTGGDFAVTSLPASVTVTNNAGRFGRSDYESPHLPRQVSHPASVSLCTTTIPNGNVHYVRSSRRQRR